MRVLITGGAGFIGSHMCELCLRQGHSLRVIDNLSTGKRENLPQHARVEFIEGDIGEVGTVNAAMAGVDAVVHLAAVASVQASIDDPIATHRTNFDGTLNLLEAARVNRVQRFVYASSAAVYGDTERLPVGEDTPLNPLSPYAADKLAGEHYLRYYHRKHGLAGTAFRFFNIYGPRQDPSSPYSGVISIFVERLRQQQGVTLFGDGRQTRDFVYVGDLVGILYAALLRPELAGAVLNVGTGKQQSLLDLLSYLEAMSGRKIPRTHAPARVGDIVHSRADVTRLRAAMGEVPQTPLADGLKALLQSLNIALAA